MGRAVSLGLLTAALTAALLGALAWYGWLNPQVRADASNHFYPPVALPPGSSVATPGTDTEVALRLPLAADSQDGLLPDLRVRRPSDLNLIGSKVDGTLRLKFTTTIWNDGDGPVEVRGSQTFKEELRVVQYVHQLEGDPRPDNAVGSFDFAHRHGHLHLGGFADYQLWSLDGAGEPLELVATNDKVGFCLMDNVLIADEGPAAEPVYGGCEAEVQGISVGYGDVYVAALYEQDLNVSHLADGDYRLVYVVNPDNDIRELSTRNNSAYVDITLANGAVLPAER